MRYPAVNSIGSRKLLGMAAALALPVAGALVAAAAEGPAIAAELPVASQVDGQVAAGTDLSATPMAFLSADSLETTTQPAPDAAPAEQELGIGNASYYGARFAGRPTASGERFNPAELTAAHRTLPFGSRVKVTNRRNGKSVVVRINDRGPFHGNRVIDLSRRAAEQIDLVRQGHGLVELALLDN